MDPARPGSTRLDLVPVLVEVGDLDTARRLATTAEEMTALAEGCGRHGLVNEVAQLIVDLPDRHQPAAPHVAERAAVGAAEGGFLDSAMVLLRVAGDLRQRPGSSTLSVPGAAAPAEIAAMAARTGRPELARTFAVLAQQRANDDLTAKEQGPPNSAAAMLDHLRNMGVTVPRSGMFAGIDTAEVYRHVAIAFAAAGSPYRPALDRITSPAERATALVRISEFAANADELLREAHDVVAAWSTATDHAREILLTDIGVTAATRATNVAVALLDHLLPADRGRVQAALAAAAANAGDHANAHRLLDLAIAQDCPVDHLVRTAVGFAPEKAADVLRQMLVTSRDTPSLLPLLVLLDPACVDTVLELASG